MAPYYKTIKIIKMIKRFQMLEFSEKFVARSLIYACSLLMACFAIEANAAFKYDPSLTWQTLHTAHFNIHFHDGEQKLAKETAAIAEKVHKRISGYFSWSPAKPTDVVLTDRTDFSNGSATPFTNNHMNLLVSPPDDLNSVEDYNNWLEILFIHEYTHIIHLDKTSGAPDKFRSIFGRFFPWLFPNVLQPLWEIEGIATFMETDIEAGVGRGQSSLFKMLMRIEFDNGIKPVSQINQPITSWPAGTARYLYGVYFFQFVRDKYGEDKVKQLIAEHSGHIIPYMINTTTNRVLGKDLEQLWKEFEIYLDNQFGAQLKKIKSEGIHAGKQITFTNFQTTQPRLLPNGDLYYFQNDHLSEPGIRLIRNGGTTSIPVANIHTGRFDVHPQAGILVAQLDTVRNVNILSDLHHIDLVTHKKTQITWGGRYSFAAWSPDGKQIIAVRNNLGNSSLELLSDTGKKLSTLWQGKNKETISSIDWSPAGDSIIASVWRPDYNSISSLNKKKTGNWNLEQFSISSHTWNKLLDSENIEAHPRYNSDGSAIVFTADYGEIYNIHKLDLDTKRISTLTNLVGGAQYPTLNHDGSALYYAGFGPEGYNIFKLDMNGASLPALSVSLLPPEKETISKQSTNIDNSIVESSSIISSYSPFDSLKPTWWFPHLLVEDDKTEVGFFTSGADALRRHNYSLLTAYDADNNWLITDFNYIYDRWDPTVKIRAAHLSNVIRDTNGNLNRIRFSDTLTTELVFPFIKYDTQWGIHTAAVIDKDSDKKLAMNVAKAADFTDSLIGAALTFNSSKRYPISISRNNGRRTKFVFENSDAFGGYYTGSIYSANWQEYISLGKQQLIALQFSGAAGSKRPRPFRLGGNFSEDYNNPLQDRKSVV